MPEWNYQIDELFKGGTSTVLVQSNDYAAARAAFGSLLKTTRPGTRLLFRQRSRILVDTHPDLRSPRADPEECRDGTESKASMCGRYAVTLPPEAMRQMFGAGNDRINFAPRYNAAPTQQLPVIRYNSEAKIRSLDLLRWGLVPAWSKDLSLGAKAINARCEGIAAKPMFRSAFAARRAIVPATAFYEWQAAAGGRKQPFAVGLADGSTMALAGLWEGWQDPVSGEIVRSFAIITTTANEMMAPIHERMPVILTAEAWPLWLGETPAETAQLVELLKPFLGAELRAWRVGPEVGSVRNDRQELLAPL